MFGQLCSELLQQAGVAPIHSASLDNCRHPGSVSTSTHGGETSPPEPEGAPIDRQVQPSSHPHPQTAPSTFSTSPQLNSHRHTADPAGGGEQTEERRQLTAAVSSWSSSARCRAVGRRLTSVRSVMAQRGGRAAGEHSWRLANASRAPATTSSSRPRDCQRTHDGGTVILVGHPCQGALILTLPTLPKSPRGD